jgi:hypothetical protein
METDWMPPTEWGMWDENWQTWSGHGVHRTQEFRGIEAPEASRPDFTGVTIPRASPSNVGGKGTELGAGSRDEESDT